MGQMSHLEHNITEKKMLENGSLGARAIWRRPEHGKRATKFAEVDLYEV